MILSKLKVLHHDYLNDNELQFLSFMHSYLKSNGNIDAKAIAAFVKEHNVSKKEVQKMIFKFVSLFVDFMTHGLSIKNFSNLSKMKKGQLKIGIKVEYEHTSKKCISRKIALDHLAEIPDYYDRLEKMEKEAGADED